MLIRPLISTDIRSASPQFSLIRQFDTSVIQCSRSVRVKSCLFTPEALGVLLARPQNSCISPHTTDRQKFWCFASGGWCLICQSPRLICPETHTERAASRSIGTKLTIQTDCCGHSHADFGFMAEMCRSASCCYDDRQNSTRRFSQKSISGDIDSSGSGMR